jgi:hypothetical protein|nr:MAG TPA: hypothetical protein [Caudoviricetes sp.]
METKATYKAITDPNVLMDAAKQYMKGVMWKYSTQAYYLDRIERIRITKERLENRDRMSDGFVQFTVCERGKRREIRSIHINERVVHRALNDVVLVPTLRPKLIYDNAASLKDRGTLFALKRLKVHLWKYYREHGTNDGYILTGDLHSYFDSIDHDVIFREYGKIFAYDPDIVNLIMDFVDAFGDKSLGLGSQVSQMTAVYYPNRIDHYIKEQLKVKGYGRYMDDFYLIHESREYLQECLKQIRQMYADIGIELNEKKTRIVRLSDEFKFLKAKTHLTDTGRVVMRPDRGTITRERRKLKALRRKLDAGEITFADVRQAYNSWQGHIKHFDSYRTRRNMDNLFQELFSEEIRKERSGNNGKKHKNYRGEFKRYDFPERIDPAERRHRV